MKHFDIIVIGGGVAGGPCAMLLARLGYKVLLVERQQFPRDTLSTHFIWPRGVSYLNRWGVAKTILDKTPHFTRLEMNIEGISLKGSVPISHLEAPFRKLHGHSWGVTNLYCGPRRYFLDQFLLDQAKEAGVEVHEGTSFAEPIIEDGVVKGIKAIGPDGKSMTLWSRLVIGADGRHSTFARQIGARMLVFREPSTFAYWSYFSNIKKDELAFFRKGRLGMAIFPTSDGTHMVLAYGATAWWDDFRKDAENNFMKTCAFCAPEVADLVRQGKREEPFKACGTMPAFQRELYGPGWVLIGDAGSFKDQATAIGITHAFRDAELITGFIDRAFSGETTMEKALSDFSAARASDYNDYFNLVCQVAEMNIYTKTELEFFYSTSSNQALVDQLISQFGDTLPLSTAILPERIGAMPDFISNFGDTAEIYRVNAFKNASFQQVA